MKNPIGLGVDDKTAKTVQRSNKGLFLPGSAPGPGRPKGAKNKKSTQTARDIMREKGVDPIAKLCDMLNNPQQGLENAEIIEINEILLRYDYVDPAKEQEVIDVEEVVPSGIPQIDYDALAAERIDNLAKG